MNDPAITIRTRVTSETLRLPQLRPLIGHDVEIVVRDAPGHGAAQAAWETTRAALAAAVVSDTDPFGPACPPEEWEALS